MKSTSPPAYNALLENDPPRGKTNNVLSDQVRHKPGYTSRARSLKFRIKVEEELYYSSSENKGADQLRSYCEADMRLCFRLCRFLIFPCGGSNLLQYVIYILGINKMDYIIRFNYLTPFRLVSLI